MLSDGLWVVKEVKKAKKMKKYGLWDWMGEGMNTIPLCPDMEVSTAC